MTGAAILGLPEPTGPADAELVQRLRRLIEAPDPLPGELGISADRVRVVCEYMGGGFGSKNSAGEYTFAAAELARRTGRPCGHPNACRSRSARRSAA